MFARNAIWHETDSVRWRAALQLALEASLGLLLAIGSFLAIRRLTGALESPLAPFPLACSALALTVWAATLRLRLRDREFDWLVLAVLVLFAVGCSFPGERAVDWFAWLGTLAVVGLVPAMPASEHRTGRTVGVAEVDGERVLQRLTRSRTTDGGETIVGTILAEFEAGERVTIVHVAFCPPFERLPTIAVEAADGVAKVTQLLHQGARIEVRLSRGAALPQAVAIELLVTADPPVAVRP